MHKTLTTTHSKQNFYTPNSTGCLLISASDRAAIDFCLVSLGKKINRLKSQMGQEIDENQILMGQLKNKLQKEVQESNNFVHKNANDLQNLQTQSLENCKNKAIQTSQADRQTASEFQKTKIQSRTQLLTQELCSTKLGHIKETNSLNKKLNQISQIYGEEKRNSEEDIYIMLGECQNQIDTLEVKLGEYERRCSESLNNLQEKVEDMYCELDGDIRKQVELGRKDYQLVENLVQKLINKMSAL